MRLAAAMAVAAALPWIPAGTIPTHGWVGAGPVLGGSRVVWASDRPTDAIYVSGPVRRVWRAPRVVVPADVPHDPFYDVRVVQAIRTVSSSATTTAFVRAIDLQLVSQCAFVLCGPFRTEPFRGELWTGRPTGPFRRIAGGEDRPIVLDADVDGTSLAYSDGSSRVVLLRRAERPTVLASSRGVVFSRVALAGRYAAWLERQPVERWPAPLRTLVVYDLAARQVAYTLGPETLGRAVLISFDLQRDGAVALAGNPSPAGGCDGGVAWASVAEPRPHFLAGNAIPWHIRIAGGRVAFITRSCDAPTPYRLVVETLEGRVVSDRVVAYGGFDFDGRRVTYLESPKEVALARVQ